MRHCGLLWLDPAAGLAPPQLDCVDNRGKGGVLADSPAVARGHRLAAGRALSAVSLLFLLIGQRLAKDYAGAMTLAVYFIICLFGLYLLNK